MHTDCKIDGRKVVCPNASLPGYAKGSASKGDLIMYRSGERIAIGRVLGRVTHLETVENRRVEVVSLLTMQLSDNGLFAYERWIAPKDVLEVRECDESAAAFAAFFFAPKLPYDAQTMRRLM